MFKTFPILITILFALPATSIAQEGLPQPKNDNEARNIQTMTLWGTEVWGNGRLDLVDELVAPDYVRHGANGTRVVSPESYAKEIEAGRANGWQFTTHAAAIDGDFIWTRWSFSGQRPDGEKVTGKGIQIYRLENGKLAETWNMAEIPGDSWVD